MRGELQHRAATLLLGVTHGDLGRVEVAHGDDRIAVRDSKDPSGPMLLFTPLEWRAFLDGVRDGEFDLA